MKKPKPQDLAEEARQHCRTARTLAELLCHTGPTPASAAALAHTGDLLLEQLDAIQSRLEALEALPLRHAPRSR